MEQQADEHRSVTIYSIGVAAATVAVCGAYWWYRNGSGGGKVQRPLKPADVGNEALRRGHGGVNVGAPQGADLAQQEAVAPGQHDDAEAAHEDEAIADGGVPWRQLLEEDDENDPDVPIPVCTHASANPLPWACTMLGRVVVTGIACSGSTYEHGDLWIKWQQGGQGTYALLASEA